MGRQLKLRIETTGVPSEEVARLLRDVSRRIDDGRVQGIVNDRNGHAVGVWRFEDTILRAACRPRAGSDGPTSLGASHHLSSPAEQRDRQIPLVTVIGSSLQKNGSGDVVLALWTQERGPVGFIVSPRAIRIIREELTEAEFLLSEGPVPPHAHTGKHTQRRTFRPDALDDALHHGA